MPLQFFNVEEAIVYSSNYASISSVIPAFAKRGDIVVCDKVFVSFRLVVLFPPHVEPPTTQGISHALQTGVLLSRSTTYWFKHNDPEVRSVPPSPIVPSCVFTFR